MKPIDDEELQAWLDGALDDEADARVAAAVAGDPALAKRAEHMRRLRERLRAGFDPVLAEPVPDRLLALLDGARPGAAGPATSGRPGQAPFGRTESGAGERPLSVQAAAGPPEADGADAAQAKPSGDAPRPASRPMQGNGVVRPLRRQRFARLRRGGPVYALAASLALLAVSLWWRPDAGPVRLDGGRLAASGELARGLDNGLAGRPGPDERVAIGLSFRDAQGRICRSFALRGDAPLAGLACRTPGGWELPVLAAPAQGSEDGLRQAGSTLPPEVQAAVDARLRGDAFDAAEERRAREAGWR